MSRECPKCGSTKLSMERRPDGDCHCLQCKHKWKPSQISCYSCKENSSSFKKTTRLKIEKGKDGVCIFLNDMELETVTSVSLSVVPGKNTGGAKSIRIELEVPEVELETMANDIQLTTNAYKRCENCGNWIVPSIGKSLKEKIVTAEYTCAPCNWKKTVKIQDWNNGIKEIKPKQNDFE
jgi:hypothetical protein